MNAQALAQALHLGPAAVEHLIQFAYLLATALFVLSLKWLSHPDTARRGVMRFIYSVGAEKICNEGWKEGLAANTPNASAELKSKFDTLCSYMEDMGEGDEMSFDYSPATGTAVTVKGKAKGTIAGKDFSDALFGCWLGPKPGPGEDFKKALLGG